MSHALINRSPDLKRLRDEGYDIEIRSSYLLLKHIPYVNSKREVRFGTLVCPLTLAGDVTTKPSNHVVDFVGEYPCNSDGSEIRQIRNQSGNRTLEGDLVVQHAFSNKPEGGYANFYDKMTQYVAILSHPAKAIDPSVTAQTFPVVELSATESVFNYLDTASSRAGINNVSRKLEIGKLAIVGLGGSGSYVLDLIAKTPVKEIHLFDGDTYLNHNAFRSPGAPSIEELRSQPRKANYFAEKYSKMRRNIIPHDSYIDATNVDQLQGMNFVFLSLDKGGAKRLIVDRLEEWNIPFIDVGMGVELIEESLIGSLRVTTSTAEKREHVRTRISFSDDDADDDYAQNIQIADLNALNAALAVVKWKKLCGFYRDLEREHNSVYVVSGDTLLNEDNT